MNPQLETSLVTAFAAILGTMAGGLSTFATTVYSARYSARRDVMLKNVASREELYSSFITEAMALYIDSLDKSLEKPETLLNLFATIGRIRLVSSDQVLAAAEKIGDAIYESYRRPSMSVEEVWEQLHQDNSEDSHLKQFTRACREEREAMLRGISNP
jgi:hypothetical protein